MVGLYASISIAILVYVLTDPTAQQGSMVVLFYLLSLYMAARAVAMYIKYRQDTRPPRYSRAYIEARDLLIPSAQDGPAAKAAPSKEKGSG
jgi:hypothetical protein